MKAETVIRVFLAACAAAALAAHGRAQQPKPAQAKPAAPAPAAPQRPAAPAPRPAPPAPAARAPQDVVATMRYSAAENMTTSTVSAKSGRQRVDYGGEMTVITECETGRLVQLNEARQRFFVTTPPDAAPSASKKGGVVALSTAVVDTGERKPLFGMTARHLKTTVIKQPAAGACDKRKERVETDGWFVDRPAAFACASADRQPAFHTTGDCVDEMAFSTEGPAAGYPLEYTVTSTIDGGKPAVMTMAVTSFERRDLPDSLFAAPDGYAEVKTLADLSAETTPAASKVGVVALSNRTKDAVSLEVLSDALVVSLTDAGVNAVRLEASSPAAAMNEARARSMDYVLITQVTDISKPARGVLGKVGGSKEYGAKVDYLLTAPGAAAARLSASERSGTSSLQSAVSTARTVARFVTPFGILSSQFKFISTFSDLSGGAPSSTMSQSPDPVINTIFSLVGVSPAKPAASTDLLLSEDAAVAAALEKEVAAIAAALRK